MIRILHIVHAVTKGDGLVNFIMNYYRNIDRNTLQFDFLYFREVENDFKNEISSLGGRYYKLDEPSLSYKFFREREGFFNIHGKEYSAIHCHALFATFVFADVAKKHGIKTIIAHSHNTIFGVGLRRKIRNLFFVYAARNKATNYVACGEQAGRFMFGNNAFDAGKVKVFTNAIDCNKYRFDIPNRNQIRSEFGIDNSTFVIGLVGSFSKQKNHSFLLDIFADICRYKKNAVLFLIGGDGLIASSTKNDVIKKTEMLFLQGKVKFLGLRSDVNKLLSAMDVFVMPSIFEGLPFSLVEAQTNGLQCFTSNVVTKEVNLGLCTYLSLQDSSEVWASDILKKMENINLDDRFHGINLGRENGFDIKFEAKKLQYFYESLEKKH